MDFLNSITNCFGSTARDNHAPDDHEKPRRDPKPVRSAKDISKDVIQLLRVAEKNGPTLRRQVNDAVGEQGWTESIARAIVAGLEALIKQSRDKIGPVLGDFIDKAEDAAKAVFAFPHQHPYLTAGFATIVAVGVLVLVAPWAVEALGLAEMGPVAGKDAFFCRGNNTSGHLLFKCATADAVSDSFAAWWQFTYAGFVPKNSLFSFFQRLGMIWGQ